MIVERPLTDETPPASPRELPPLDHYIAVGEAHGISWTPLRQQILELLWESGNPQGPYALADELRKTRNVYPNSLYRILAVLEEAQLIVAIVSTRRVQISPNPGHRDWAVLHCSKCERLELVPCIGQAEVMRETARHHGYVPEKIMIECFGQCRSCDAAVDDAVG